MPPMYPGFQDEVEAIRSASLGEFAAFAYEWEKIKATGRRALPWQIRPGIRCKTIPLPGGNLFLFVGDLGDDVLVFLYLVRGIRPKPSKKMCDEAVDRFTRIGGVSVTPNPQGGSS
jgi:hypothetical protein